MTGPHSSTRILMVCMGNICRSPLAECMLRHKAVERGVDARFVVDSAGTGAWHVGSSPDARVRRTAAAHGIEVAGTARQVTAADFSAFDLLVCMDQGNKDHLLGMGAPPAKVRLLLQFAMEQPIREVPDPYYGGDEGFETVHGLVDAACEGLIEALLAGKA